MFISIVRIISTKHMLDRQKNNKGNLKTRCPNRSMSMYSGELTEMHAETPLNEWMNEWPVCRIHMWDELIPSRVGSHHECHRHSHVVLVLLRPETRTIRLVDRAFALESSGLIPDL